MLILRLIICIVVGISSIYCELCTEDDYEYTYTNCDANGERWRVAIPRHNSRCDSLPPPQKGLNCSFSCPAGNYLDLDTQNCRPCSAGFFSLGGGVRFEEFVFLPQGFSIENFDPNADSFSSVDSIACPKETGWVVKDGELMYIPTPCISKLSFSANLVRPGSVEFTYRWPRNSRALSMQVDVRNEQCQSYGDMARSMMMKYGKGRNNNKAEEERNGDWRRRRVEMKSGLNVISWTISNNVGYRISSQESIHFSRIDILGLAFTRDCTACPPGTYSTPGSAECIPCAAGYFSSKGSSKCGRCPQSQYSGPKSGHCIDRPPCRQSDYYPVREPCTNGSSRVTYKRVMPDVCRDDLPDSAKMPPPGPWSPCPKCNPGMAKNTKGVCEFCKKNYFSDGNECKRCPVDTIPNYSLQYSQWNEMPPKLTTRCEYISDDVSVSCNIGDSWIPSGDSLISAPSLERGIAFELILSIDEGFSNPLAAKTSSSLKAPIAHVTFVFETSCSDSSCTIYFIEDVSAATGSKESFYRFLAAFNGTQSKRVWSHPIVASTPARFMVAFLRSGVASSDDSITDEARIFAINVTNVGHRGGQGGGASQCLSCPHSDGGEACVPCPAGNYMHETTKLCVSCPPNSIINASSSRVGIESCIPCGEGLSSKDGVSCVSSGNIKLKIDSTNTTYSYDFSKWIQRNWSVNGVRVFSRDGAAYYHLFKLSLFSNPIVCEEEFNNLDTIAILDQAKEKVEGLACRVTVLPSSNRNRTSSTATVSPFLIASRLDSITLSRSHNSWNLTNHQILEYDELNNSTLPTDVFFWYDPIPSTASSCPNGNILVVVARCVPQKKQAEMRLPHSCPDGTCDGCIFVVFLESAQACPVCDKDDYETIRGECVQGRQTIHSIPHKHCVLTGSASESHEVECSNLTPFQRFLMITAVLIFALVCISFITIFKRNRRLEYKYTRLIESRTGELPAAETCGLDEDDEEEEMQDRVIFSKGRRNNRHTQADKLSRDNDAFISLDCED